MHGHGNLKKFGTSVTICICQNAKIEKASASCPHCRAAVSDKSM